jgi:hypothetical protein
MWYSKSQNTIESSTIGAEFFATRIAVEIIEGLHYKLRMFGIPIEGPANTFVDDNSVVWNATVATSTLKRKHNSIAYHRVWEAIAANVIRFAKVSGEKNHAGMLTKPLPANELTSLMRKVLYFPNAYEQTESSAIT